MESPKIEEYSRKIFPVNEELKIIMENDKGTKTWYTEFEGKQSGIRFEYDRYNRINKKGVFFQDTLIQEKEYYWGENRLDSIVFSSYEYKSADSIFKYPIVTYPTDSIFFDVKYQIISKPPPLYTFNLIGNGAIGFIEEGDKIYSAQEINSRWESILKVKKHLTLKPVFSDGLTYSYSSQSFLLLINRGKSIAVKKQFNLVFISFIVNKHLGLLNSEIVF